MAADCNENMFYGFAAALRFFRDLKNMDYLYSSLVVRPDTREINLKLGISLIWEDFEMQKKLGMKFPPLFYEGKLSGVFDRKI